MKLFLPWDRRASVYDRAGSQMGVALALVAVGISLFMGGIGLGWFIGAAGALLMSAFHPSCPRCGKSPLRQALISRKSAFYHFWQANRLWPEHICSQCGLNLTVSHGVQADE